MMVEKIFCLDDMIFYLENPKEFIKNTFRSNKQTQSCRIQKINTQNQLHLYILEMNNMNTCVRKVNSHLLSKMEILKWQYKYVL